MKMSERNQVIKTGGISCADTRLANNLAQAELGGGMTPTREPGDAKMAKAIAKKILMVRKSVGVVAKGQDANQNFQYQKWDDVFPAVWDACVKHSVVISQTVDEVTYHEANPTGRGIPQKRVEVRMKFRVIDVDSGEFLESSWHGEAVGADDKILQKAITSATKYFFLKGFGIPFNEKDGDTDGTNPDVYGKPATTPPAKRQPETKATPTQFNSAAYAKTIFTAEQFAEFKENWPDKTKRDELLEIAWSRGHTTIAGVLGMIASEFAEDQR